MSYGAGLYGSTPYGSAPGSAGPEVYAPTVNLRVIVCVGQVVQPLVHLRVTVFEQYAPALPLEITVRQPQFAPTVPLSISVFETFTPVLGLAITITDDAEIPPPAAVGVPADVWSMRVTLGTADVSARLTGVVEVDADADAARVARFALAPAGTVVDLADLARKAVTVTLERMDSVGAVIGRWRLFTGVVDTPEFNPATRVIAFTCSDARQAKVAAMTRAQIDALIPDGLWSPFVFDRYADSEQYLADRLSTVAGSVDGDEYGTLGYTAWAGAATRTFTEDQILDGTLQPQLAAAAAAKRTRLTMTYRRPEVVIRGIDFRYEAPSLSSQFYLGHRALTRNAVEQALSGSGATVVGDIGWMPYPTASAIDGIGGVIASPNDAPALCVGAWATLNRRYSRWIDETFVVEIGSTGTLVEEQRIVSVEWDTTENDNSRPPANSITAFLAEKGGPIPKIKQRATPGETHVAYVPDGQPDAAAWEVAYKVAVRVAAKSVAESLRGSTISFSVPMDPSITLRNRIAVDTDVCSGAGKVVRVRHVADIEAGTAISQVELECVSVTLPAVTMPTRPTIPTAIKPGSLHCRAETWIGGLATSRPWEEKVMFGFSTNASQATAPPGAERYPEAFSVMVPGIEDAAQGTVAVPPQCTMVAGSNVISALTSTDGFDAEVGISGSGLPTGTTIVSVDATARTATLSAAATVSGKDREVRVETRQYIPRIRAQYAPTLVRVGPIVGA